MEDQEEKMVKQECIKVENQTHDYNANSEVDINTKSQICEKGESNAETLQDCSISSDLLQVSYDVSDTYEGKSKTNKCAEYSFSNSPVSELNLRTRNANKRLHKRDSIENNSVGECSKIGTSDISLLSEKTVQTPECRHKRSRRVRRSKGRVHKDDVENFKGVQPKATPLARKIALDLGVDLSEVVGTGARGKIQKEDVYAYLNANKPVEKSESVKVEEAPKAALPDGVEVIKMSAMRKAISKGMTHSYLTAPTFTLNYDIDMTNLMALRKQVLEPIMNKTGLKVTFTDLIGLAVTRTLMKEEHRYLNASLINDAQEIELHKFVNMGIAVGLDDGLVVPVVHGADKMSLSEFVVASKDVIKKAQSGKLKAAEMSGSTFSITNLGMFGTKTFNPIINQPNSAILGVAATVQTPVVIDGQVVIRPIMAMCLTIDHRLVDGMNGAKFMVDLKKLLENPLELLI